MSNKAFTDEFKDTRLGDALGVNDGPEQILAKLKSSLKLSLQGTAREQLVSIPKTVTKLERLEAEYDNIGSGELAGVFHKLAVKFQSLNEAVATKELTSAKEFKSAYKALCDGIINLDVEQLGQDSRMLEGVEQVKKLTRLSLSEALQKKKQPAFFMEVPVVITGKLSKNFRAKLGGYWQFNTIMDAGTIIGGVKFVVVRKSKVKAGQIEEFVKALTRIVNNQTTTKVVPYFDIQVETQNGVAILLIPEREARYAAAIFDNYECDVYLKG